MLVVFCLFLGLLLGGTAVGAEATRPDWVVKRPLPEDYYVGIGSVTTDGAAGDSRQAAKNEALSDLASEISVTISAESFLQKMEVDEEFTQEYRSLVRTATLQKLEGYEIVDTWQGDGEFWVYCRLSRQEYEAQRLAARRKAEALALDHFTRAAAAASEGSYGAALKLYLQALGALEDHLGETSRVKFQGREVFLSNEIFASLNQVLDAVELEPRPASLAVQHGRPLKQGFAVRAICRAAEGQSRPVTDLPLRFSFLKGEGQLLEEAVTGRDGEASGTLSRIESRESLQILAAEVDLARLAGRETSSPLLKTLLRSLQAPATRILLNVTGALVYMEVDESSQGQALDVPIVEPTIKKALVAQGFAFVASPAEADYLVKIRAEARAGTQITGSMVSCFADLSLSLTDLAAGQELFQGALTAKKGIDLTYEKAGAKALQKAAEDAVGSLVQQMRDALGN